MDKHFKVEIIAKTPNPQQVIYAAMHQDYSEQFVAKERDKWPTEEKCGEIIVNRLLAGGRGHYGCYSTDTEVLTGTGWKLWPTVTTNDQLLAINIETKTAHFENPSAVQSYDVAAGDKLYHFSNEAVDLLVTEDHRMVVSDYIPNTNITEWKFIERAEEISDVTNLRRLPLNCWLTEEARFTPHDTKINLFDALGYAGSLFYGNVTPEKLEKLPGWVVANFWDKERQVKVLPDWFVKLPVQCILSFFSSMNIRREKDSLWVISQGHLEEKWSDEITGLFQATAHINGWFMSIDGDTITLDTTEARTKPESVELVDYTGKVYCATVSTGALMVRRNGKVAICGNCIEHPQITFNCGYFPHSVVQQGRTHRLTSWDVQSARYTSTHIVQAALGDKDIEEVFYLRPVGEYTDRQGKKYYYSPQQREQNLLWCLEAAKRYAEMLRQGMSEEHARGILPFDYRQHFIVSFNARAFLHFMDLRSKKDAQLEIQQLCELMWPHFKEWMPAVAEWYKENRLGKARLAP